MGKDFISLLPDAVANQIAAGEVVQRPASIVKETLENSIDAGADNISLIVKEAGKSLVQIIDNGRGMSHNDARMAFERHATSKIKTAEDIFRIVTMGFRGEALASIAAVAQVELKTRMEEEELGTELRVEGSKVTHQGFCQCAVGTNFTVKNLFYNIPARRNFLKSNPVEMRHIIDEFQRVALAHPKIAFRLVSNEQELFNLPKGNLRQRIMGILGKKYDERIVPVKEETDVVKVSGYVMKPQFARKTRGEQFFFVNNRFVKNNYLHHAVADAFSDLISGDERPGYVLFLTIDPARIDINIHPTKTEINFDDERAVYAILRAATKHALGRHNMAPSLDFNTDVSMHVPAPKPGQKISTPGIMVNPNFNPFEEEAKKEANRPSRDSGFDLGRFQRQKPEQNWAQFFPSGDEAAADTEPAALPFSAPEGAKGRDFEAFQISNTYIVCDAINEIEIVNQQRAHEWVLFCEYLQSLKKHAVASQQLLFPQQLEFGPADMAVLDECLDDLRALGFDIEKFGKSGLVIQGLPVSLKESEVAPALERIAESAKNQSASFKENRTEMLAAQLAKSSSIKAGQPLNNEEIQHLLSRFYEAGKPETGLAGKPVYFRVSTSELQKRLP